MRARQFWWIDAFTDRAMGGNPCAVVADADDLDVEQRLAFTRETRLSECAFLVSSDKADFGARYYLASREILMAGHPTVSTAAALDAAGLLDGRERFTLEIGAGVIRVDVDRSGASPVYTMTQPAPSFGRTYDPAEIAPLVGLEPGDFADPPQTVSTGTAFAVSRLTGLDALRRARLDAEALTRLQPEVDFWEPFLCVTEGFTPAGDTAARLMLVPPEPPEDPFTGAATGCMGAWLWHHGHIPERRFTAEQGHGMGRPGRASVEVLGPPEAIEGVRVGGNAVVLMQGQVTL